MATFIIGLVILFGGAALYGTLCEKVFGPDDRATPAYAKQDGVDYVPMRCWKNRASCLAPSRSSPSPSATSSVVQCTTTSAV